MVGAAWRERDILRVDVGVYGILCGPIELPRAHKGDVIAMNNNPNIEDIIAISGAQIGSVKKCTHCQSLCMPHADTTDSGGHTVLCAWCYYRLIVNPEWVCP